jgi:predicted O-linked N-acetylglucosamine transferase (SPINDLY family)
MSKDFELAVQCHQAGLLDKALVLCRKVLIKKPRHAQALYLLGFIAHQKNDLVAAITWYQKAIVAKSDFAQAYHGLGAALIASKRVDEGIESIRSAVVLKPDYAEAINNLGIALKDAGMVEEALDAQRRAFSLHRSWYAVHSACLLTRHSLEVDDPLELLADHLTWDRIYASHLSGVIAPHANGRSTDRRLRIGLVSPDFKQHPVMRFLLPFLEHRDRDKFEMFAYSQVSQPDVWTELARKQVDHWRSLVDMTDAEAADLIRADEIDILIDLAGHSCSNRLMVFAHKPAPVQATYLGYPGTTGLSAIDYRISDAFADPPGMTEGHHSEQLIRLSGCAWCYGPDLQTLPNESPALKYGVVTFGSFNNLAKISERTLGLWARILEAVPGSRLLLKSAGFLSMEARRRVREALCSKSGISEERVEIRGPEDSHESHLDLYREMDIALDTFPYHGTTTTCEALWMGVPVVTLAGRTHVSRVGVSLLTNVGLPELVAESEDEYVRIAVELAGDVGCLVNYRTNLREKMLDSPLLDAATFSRDMEAAFRQMWMSWVASANSSKPAIQ